MVKIMASSLENADGKLTEEGAAKTIMESFFRKFEDEFKEVAAKNGIGINKKMKMYLPYSSSNRYLLTI